MSFLLRKGKKLAKESSTPAPEKREKDLPADTGIQNISSEDKFHVLRIPAFVVLRFANSLVIV